MLQAGEEGGTLKVKERSRLYPVRHNICLTGRVPGCNGVYPMHKATIVGIGVAILALGGIVWIARPAPDGASGPYSGQNSQTGDAASVLQNSDEALRADEASFDFGTISMAAGTVRHTFKIQNAGTEPVVIGKIYTSCMCTIATLALDGKQFGPYGMPRHGFIPKINGAMAPGEEASVEVVFDPAAHGPAGVGRLQRIVTVEYNAGQPLEIGFTALVTP